MDSISINKLEVFAKHGVLPEEQRLGQKFVISVKLYLDTWMAAALDDLTKTINYAEASALITEYEQAHPVKLLETAANDLAVFLLKTYSIVKGVDVCIEKPWAPIGLPLSEASVRVSRSRHTAYIGLGSNKGDSKAILQEAVNKLSTRLPDQIEVSAVSAFYITKPYGVVDQPDFVNGCVEVQTICEPEQLLIILQELEQEEHRTREMHWGPRTLDLDLLLFDGLCMNTRTLTLPHPLMMDRMFVLAPLCEIAPWLVHPLTHERIADGLNRLKARCEEGFLEGMIVEQA